MRNARLALAVATAGFIVLLVFFGLTVAQQERGQKSLGVDLELVWLRDFEEEIIAGVPNGNTTIVITEDKVYAVDNTSGEIGSPRPTYQGIQEPKWRRTLVHSSENGQYIALCHQVLVNEQSMIFGTPQRRLVQIEIINDVGKQLWSLPIMEVDPRGEYVFYGGCWPSNEGYVVVTDEDKSGKGKLVFHNPKGERIRELVYSKGKLELGANSKGVFSEDGQYFTFYGNEGIKDEADSPSYLLLMDEFGKLIWEDARTTLAEGYGFGGLQQKLAVSSGGTYVAVTTYRTVKVLLFSKTGNLLWQNELPTKFAPGALSFTHDEQTLLISDERNLRAFASSTGERLWDTQMEGFVTSLTLATERGHQYYVLTSGSELVLINGNGKLLGKADLVEVGAEPKARGRTYPALSSHQNLVAVVFPYRVCLYQIRKH